VKELQALCGRLDFKHLHIEQKLMFLSKMLSLKNDVAQICLTVLIALLNAAHYVRTVILMLADVLQRPLRKRCIMGSVILLLLLFKCESMCWI